MSTIYKAVTTFLFVVIPTMPSLVCQAQETDAGCVRKYFMGKCENKALREDFEERGEVYVIEEAMFSIIRTRIPSVLHHDRFVMIQPSFVIKSKTEYFFEATYDCARDPVIREREIQNGDTIEEELYPSYLNLRLYFDGDQKELVKEWTVSSTMHFFDALTNKMFENKTSLLRTEVPITNLLDEFEKKPVFCRLDPEETQLDKGEETEISLSDFKDARMMASREFNRILVHATEGEILNGEKSGSGDGYKVFRLDELPIIVKYKAPDHGEAISDRITVFNSCDIIPVEKLSLRSTSLGDQISSCDLLLNSYDWTGTINLEITQTYNCNVDEQVRELHHSRTIAGDHKHTVAKITLGLSDFDLPKQGTNAEAKLQYISGQVTFNMREDHTTEGNAQKTQCHNDGTGKWEWVSPGSWGTTHQTMTGQAYCDIEDGGLTLLIAKEMVGDKEAMDNKQQQMAEMQARLQEALKSMDTQAMNKIKGEMQKLAQGEQGSSSIPIKVAINISTGSIYYPVYATYERKAFDVCSGDFDENESRSEILELPLALPLGAEMKGLYTRDDKGNDRIEASINDSQPYFVTFGSGICPEGTMTITGSITLERRKE